MRRVLAAVATCALVSAGFVGLQAAPANAIPSGRLLAFGDNSSGQLGDGTTTDRLSPSPVTSVTNAKTGSAGCSHTALISGAGNVLTMGANAAGQLGNGTTTPSSNAVQVSGLSGIADVAAGCTHNLAVANDGSVFSWGANGFGQLGDGTTTNRLSPVKLTTLTSAQSVAAGANHSLVALTNGAVLAFGDNAQGQLGLGTTVASLVPKQVGGLPAIKAVDAGCDHSLALAQNGTVWGWGDNARGQLGNGSVLDSSSPVQVQGLPAGIAEIAAGCLFSLARTDSGAVYAWGANDQQQLGDSTVLDRPLPVLVSGLPTVTRIDAGRAHSAAVTADHHVFMWGSNSNGQLGNGSKGSSSAPQDVDPTIGPIDIPILGEIYTLLLRFDTTVPTVDFTKTPPGVSNSTDAEFALKGDDADDPSVDLTFHCQLDNNQTTTCPATVTFTGLLPGNHFIHVFVTDPAGNQSVTIQFLWIIDTTAPVVSILSGPSATTNNTSASFSFTASDPDDREAELRYECQLDGSTFAPCDSPQSYANLSDGPHTFGVRAHDEAGNYSSVATQSWNIDTAGPVVTITSSPANPTNQTNATIGFTVSDPNDPLSSLTIVCAIDGNPAATCAPPSVSYSGLAQGSHTVAIGATDPSGNSGGASVTWTIDTTAPAVVIDTHPSDPSNSSSATFTFHSPDASATLTCQLDGGAVSPCPTGTATYSGLADGSHTFTVTATDGAGNSASASFTWTVDTAGPDVVIDTHPSDPSNSSSASFTFHSSDPTATLTCKLDSGAAAPCSTGTATYSGLTDGSHTFTVTATDLAGNSASASFTWAVDTIGPGVVIDTHPSDPSNSLSASFTFHSPDATATLTCQLDSDPVAPCPTGTATYGPLADGSHTFTVTATDGSGNSSSASFTWTIDTIGPDVFIDTHPSDPSNSSSATFTVHSSDPTATLACQVDGGLATDCSAGSATFNGLADGSHTFTVTATDGAGNSASASFTWTVDTTLPGVVIDSHPSNPSNSSSASFTFHSPDATATLTCQLDSGAATDCSTGTATYNLLADGSHTFTVTATDGAGNSSSASFTWTIDLTPPTVTITSHPFDPTNQTTAGFAFVTSDTSAVTTTCSIDGGPPAPCTSPTQYTGLGAGSHTFTVTATDAAGNSASDSFTWTIDLTAPITTIDTAPANPTFSTTATFTFHANETPVTFSCNLDSGNFVACSSGITLNGLTPGSHTFRVHATDAAGNTGPDATYTWVIGAQTFVAYMGPNEVPIGTSFRPSVAIYSDLRPCMVGQTVSAAIDRNPFTGVPGAFSFGSVVSDADGRGLLATQSTAGWQEGVYTVTVNFAGTSTCSPSTATGSLRVGRETNLVAKAIIAEVLPGGSQGQIPGVLDLTLTTFTGTLTQKVTGAPIAGANLDFFVGDQYICSALTDANGQATCGGLVESIEAILNLEYTAKFNGDNHFLSSSANGPLLRVLNIPILPV